MNAIKKLTLLAFAALTVANANAQSAKQSVATDGMFIRGNQVYYIKGGAVNRLPAGDQDLTGKAKITSFGKITMTDGTVHQLAPGELVDFNGNLTSTKVEEYVTVQNGNAVIITNGIVSGIESGFKFGDDKQVDPYGNISDGLILKEGQKMDMNGQLIK